MEWTEAQIDGISRAFSYRQALGCPVCRAPISAEEEPGGTGSRKVVAFLCSGCGRKARLPFMTIGPEDFIHKPFTRCPACGEERFGLLSVYGDSYAKRCAACLHSDTYSLPALRKTVIYLDQPAISNMMFVVNPETPQFKERRVDPFWFALFGKLDRLSKLQLIVCPDTDVQEEESLVHMDFEALRHMYEQLSHGVTFYDAATIERFQLQMHARNWLAGRPEDPPDLQRERIVHGDLNGWIDVLHIAVRGRVTGEQIEALRATRGRTHEGIARVFEKWRGETGLPFEAWFEREVAAAGRTILQIYDERVRRLAEAQMRLRVPSMEDFEHPQAVVVVTMIQNDFEESGLTPEEALRKAREYLSSASLRHVPSIKISAMLWASIARKAAAGRRRPPSQGSFNDIKVIASILPYCDALFIDNEMCGYLQEQPLVTDLRYGARVFCQNSRDEFLAYLDEVERAAQPEHVALVKRVYGENWGQPYTGIFGGKKA